MTAALARRREAALRLPPLHSGYRDPLDALVADDPGIYGLSLDERRAEARRLLAQGWTIAEVRHRLDLDTAMEAIA